VTGIVFYTLTFVRAATTIKQWLVVWHVDLPLVARVVVNACAVDFA
jgi:hypothetical protein